MSKIVEFIRQILIKTILPFRRRKEEFLSQFRFSIEFRISLKYLKLVVVNGILLFFAMVFTIFGMQLHENETIGKTICQRIEQHKLTLLSPEYLKNTGIVAYEYTDPSDLKSYHEYADKKTLDEYRRILYQNKVNPYFNQGIQFKITNLKTNQVLYNDIKDDISGKELIFHKYYFDKNGEPDIFIVSESKTIQVDQETLKIDFQYNLSHLYHFITQMILWWLLFSIIFVYLVITAGQRGSTKLLKPISDMSATANRLTVNNLNSERLNVEGTKNELKDLAATMNNMLDRIELSYESQKQFVSDASHELRTPIAVIQGYVNLLDRWGKKDESVMEESIEAIKNEAQSMQELVEKLLFLSRHDKKTLKLKKTKFNMKEIIEDMAKETKLVTENRNILAPVLDDVIVYGDEQALKQAVRVFVENAIKYTNDGDTISISCRNDEGDCIITVADSGIGMTRKDLDNIFCRFYRSDQVRNEKISGHGLGLSIAKLIILKHSGIIKVKSQLTRGSSFTIILPKINL
jgi:Signal transduction histidine kinase